MTFFLQGLLLGVAYVAPIGLQNLFVINTAISQKISRVYATVFIILFFDITLAFACFFGIGAIMSHFKWLEMIVLFFGSLIVIWIGIGLLRAESQLNDETKVDIPIIKVIGTACVVTWFNPQALIDGSMMLGAFRASLPPEATTKFIFGVATASVLWFLSLSTILIVIGKKLTPKMLRVINIICGIIIIIYGLKLAKTFVINLLEII